MEPLKGPYYFDLTVLPFNYSETLHRDLNGADYQSGTIDMVFVCV